MTNEETKVDQKLFNSCLHTFDSMTEHDRTLFFKAILKFCVTGSPMSLNVCEIITENFTDEMIELIYNDVDNRNIYDNPLGWKPKLVAVEFPKPKPNNNNNLFAFICVGSFVIICVIVYFSVN